MGVEFSCPTLMTLMGLLSFLVWANENVGSSGAVSPAAASARLSRREMLFPDAGDRPGAAAPDAGLLRVIVGLLVWLIEQPALPRGRQRGQRPGALPAA